MIRLDTDFKKKVKEQTKTNFATTSSFAGFIGIIAFVLFLFVSLFIINFPDVFNGSYGSIYSILLMVLFLALILGILSPFYYSYFACNTILNSKRSDDVKFTSFLKTFKFGLNKPIRGALSITINILWSILIFVFAFTILEIVVTVIYSGVNTEFQKLLTSVVEAINNNDTNSAFELIYENQALLEPVKAYSMMFSLFFASFYFCRQMVYNTFKYYLVSTFLGLPNRMISNIYKYGFQTDRKNFNKGFNYYTLPMTITFIVVFFGSYLGIYLGLYYSGSQFINLYLIGATSITLSLVVCFPFLPLIFNYFGIVRKEERQKLTFYFIGGMDDEINRAKQQARSDEEKNQINFAESRLNELKQNILDKERDDENTNDGDKNENSKDDDKKDK